MANQEKGKKKSLKKKGVTCNIHHPHAKSSKQPLVIEKDVTEGQGLGAAVGVPFSHQVEGIFCPKWKSLSTTRTKKLPCMF